MSVRVLEENLKVDWFCYRNPGVIVTCNHIIVTRIISQQWFAGVELGDHNLEIVKYTHRVQGSPNGLGLPGFFSLSSFEPPLTFVFL